MLINGLFLIVVGALGASSFILGKRPDAKEMFDKVAPIQGWLGVVSAFWGLWGVINIILNLGVMLKMIVPFVIGLVGSISLFGTGFLLGFNLIATFTAKKSPEAAKKAEELRGKLVTYQIPMGFVCIGLGLLSVVAGVLL